MKIRNNHFLSTSLLSLLLVLGTSFFPRITHAQFGGIVHDPLHAVISAVTAGATSSAVSQIVNQAASSIVLSSSE